MNIFASLYHLFSIIWFALQKKTAVETGVMSVIFLNLTERPRIVIVVTWCAALNDVCYFLFFPPWYIWFHNLLYYLLWRSPFDGRSTSPSIVFHVVIQSPTIYIRSIKFSNTFSFTNIIECFLNDVLNRFFLFVSHYSSDRVRCLIMVGKAEVDKYIWLSHMRRDGRL